VRSLHKTAHKRLPMMAGLRLGSARVHGCLGRGGDIPMCGTDAGVGAPAAGTSVGATGLMTGRDGVGFSGGRGGILIV